jgi:hypothetical protein
MVVHSDGYKHASTIAIVDAGAGTAEVLLDAVTEETVPHLNHIVGTEWSQDGAHLNSRQVVAFCHVFRRHVHVHTAGNPTGAPANEIDRAFCPVFSGPTPEPVQVVRLYHYGTVPHYDSVLTRTQCVAFRDTVADVQRVRILQCYLEQRRLEGAASERCVACTRMHM